MLRAIRNFVFKRERTIGPGPASLVEEDGCHGQASSSDDALQSAGQELVKPSQPPVRGTVKWFSPIKRYGFVAASDGSGDVFIHVSTLAEIGITTLQPGETLEFRVTPGNAVRKWPKSSAWIAAPLSRPGHGGASGRSQTDSP